MTTDYAALGPTGVRLKKTGTGPFVPEYTHFDLQGSPVAATNAAGTIAWRESYRPFGRTRLEPAENLDNPDYAGHRRDSSTGLSYMQARFYDAAIGRFYSTDPIGYQDQLNLYAYVANDPVNATDPNGEFLVPIIVGAAFGAAVEAGKQLYQTRNDKGGPRITDGNKIARAALFGAATGAGGGAVAAVAKAASGSVVAKTIFSSSANAVIGGAVGAASQIVENANDPNAGTFDGVADATFTGVVSGAVGGAAGATAPTISGAGVTTVVAKTTAEVVTNVTQESAKELVNPDLYRDDKK